MTKIQICYVFILKIIVIIPCQSLLALYREKIELTSVFVNRVITLYIILKKQVLKCVDRSVSCLSCSVIL